MKTLYKSKNINEDKRNLGNVVLYPSSYYAKTEIIDEHTELIKGRIGEDGRTIYPHDNVDSAEEDYETEYGRYLFFC